MASQLFAGKGKGVEFTAPGSTHENMRWVVCGLLFLATTINYMDRQVFSLIEPELHKLPFMGWSAGNPDIFNNNFGNVLIYFQIAYGIGLLTAGRIIDKVGTRTGYAIAILIWSCSSMAHIFVGSVAGFCVARFMLGIGESGNFPAAIKATTEWFPTEERALATGIFNSGSNIASVVAPALLPFVTATYGWRAAFLTTGSMGMIWLVLWLLFPYDKLRRGATYTQQQLALPIKKYKGAVLGYILKSRGTWGFSTMKFMTDPIWWFYLFWLPKYFHENYAIDLQHIGPPLISIYFSSSFGSIAGGWLSGHRMKRGATVNAGRKFALLVMACCALPVMLVPYMHTLFPGNVWPAVFLLALAAAAHQGWSANVFSTSTDLFPSTSVSTVVGIGGAMGALGGAIFTWITKQIWVAHPLAIFMMAGLAYVTSLLIFQLLVPNLGTHKEQAV
jgi:ACS family hexuronate transporter-like MFS transporter